MTIKSILPPELRGVMTITGPRGIGKTFLAATSDLPQNIVMIDFEDKGESVAEQLKFGDYIPLTRRAGADPLRLFQLFDQTIRNIPDGRTVVILDNISPLEIAMKAYISDNAKDYAKRYGLNAGNIISGRFGGASAAANFMVSEYCTIMHERGIRLIVEIAHIGNYWSSIGIVPNKNTIKGLDRWQQLSILSLVLIPGRQTEKAGVPAALVMKEQLGKIEIDLENLNEDQIDAFTRGELGHIITRRLPQRIPECTFQRIRHYLYNPANIESPAQGEIPLDSEIDPYRSDLSREQFEIIHAMAIKEQKEIEEEDALVAIFEQSETNEAIAKIRPLVESGTSIPEIANQLGMKIPEVATILSKLKE